MMRILGIDYGDSRIGLAISDPFGWTAQGLETLSSKNGLKDPLERIKEIITQYGVEKIVIGYPLNMDGTEGARTEKTNEFIDKLSKLADIEIVKWDERLTTVAAQRTMTETGVKTSKKKGIVDQIAAVYILQGYLDHIR